MDRVSKLLSTVLVVGSGVAFGVVAMTGVVAAVVFPTVRDLDPTLPGYAGYGGTHWSLAAGVVAERVFRIGFVLTGVALGAALLAVVGLSVRRRPLPIFRIGLCIVTVGLFLTHVAWLQPRMDDAATNYREAAGAGDDPTAIEAKSRFDALHPTASRLIGATALASLALFAVSAWQASAGAAPREVA